MIEVIDVQDIPEDDMAAIVAAIEALSCDLESSQGLSSGRDGHSDAS